MIKIGLDKIDNILCFLYAIVLFSLSKPFYMWHNTIAYFFSILFLLLYSLKHIQFRIDNIFFFVVLFLFIMLYGLRNASFDTLVLTLSSVFVFYLKKENCIKIVDYFATIYAFLLIFSIPIYICVIYMGIEFPNIIIPPLNEQKEYEYLLYPFVLIPFGSDIFLQFRFHFIHDEPGVVGTIAVFLLFINDYKLNNWKMWIIFLSGILSFSFYFIVMSIIYLAWGKFKVFLLVGLLLSVVVLIFQDDEIVQRYIFDRFEYSESSGVEGNNRVRPEFETAYNNFVKSDNLLWGVGEIRNDPSLTSSSYKNIIFHDGIIYFSLFVFFFVLLAANKLRTIRSYFIYFLLLLGMLYQRPGINHVFYFFLFYTIIAVLQKEESITLTKQ